MQHDTWPWDGKWQAAAREGRTADAVVEYVRAYDHVTLAELQHKLEPYTATEGAHALCLDEHLILWVGMSEQLVGTLRDLLRDKRLHAHPTVWLTYLADGGLCTLPVAKRIPRGGFKRDHWLPVCLRVVPLPESRRRQKVGAA